MGRDSSELRRQWVEMAVGRHTKEVTFLHNDMVDLIRFAGPSDLCFAGSDDHPTEDRTTSSELKTILNSSPELDQELGLILTTALQTAPKQSGNEWPTNYRPLSDEDVCKGWVDLSTLHQDGQEFTKDGCPVARVQPTPASVPVEATDNKTTSGEDWQLPTTQIMKTSHQRSLVPWRPKLEAPHALSAMNQPAQSMEKKLKPRLFVTLKEQ